MARRKSQSEQKMLAVGAKADEAVREKFPDPKQILHSWSASELILDVQDARGGWHRMVWVPDDDTEIAGVQELA